MRAWAVFGTVIGIIVLVVLAYFGWDQFVEFVQAPVKAQLDECRDKNAEWAKLGATQNEKIKALQTESDRRIKASEDAARKAGAGFFAEAQRILGSGALDPDACKSASLRVNRELGLK